MSDTAVQRTPRIVRVRLVTLTTSRCVAPSLTPRETHTEPTRKGSHGFVMWRT